MKRTALLIASFMFLAFTFVGCKETTPSSITSDCIEYVKDGNYEAYVNTFNMNAEEKAQLQEMFEKKGEETLKQYKGIESYEIIEENISEDGLKAAVKAKITYGNGETKEEKFRFVKVDDQWLQELNK